MSEPIPHQSAEQEPVRQPREQRHVHRVFTVAALLGTFLFLGSASAYLGFEQSYHDRIFPGVSIGTVSLGGATRAEAALKLSRAIEDLIASGYTFELDGESVTLRDSAEHPFAVFDIEGAVSRALAVGRSGGIATQLRDRLAAYQQHPTYPLHVSVNADAVSAALTASLPEASEKQNATPHVALDGAGRVISVSLNPDRPHFVPQFAEAAERLHASLADFKNSPISVPYLREEADITAALAAPHLDEVRALLELPEITVRYHDFAWTITRRTLANAVTFSRTENDIVATIDPKKLGNFFRAIADDVLVKATDAAFVVEGETVTKFIPHTTGVGVDEEAFAAALRDALFQQKPSISLITKVTMPDVPLSATNSLGIAEKLGTGFSSFKGSPKNRIQNIKNGTSKLNYKLIPPDETFSLLTALSPFDEENGYLPELVIKGNKIEPEIGGGLCQIGTTAFRAAMNSGLGIAERRNHSLVISYYNDPANGKPGTDATIYDPAPDLKIHNDTGRYLLFIAEALPDDSLVYSFWGTSDGRKASYTPPEVKKWTPVPADVKTQYLESTSVKSGEQRCKAGFPGAITSFVYTIERPDGTKNERTFESTYRMIPPVCLVAKGEIPKAGAPAKAAAPVDVPVTVSETEAAH